MTTTNSGKVASVVASCSAGLFLALVATAPQAAADPTDPVVPPVPPTVVAAPSAPNIQAAGTDVAPLPPAPNVQAAGTDVAPLPPAPEGVPHLASPDALPPGSTMVQQDPESPNVGYLRDLWQAVQNHEISGKEALVMGLAQRGMNTPYPDQAPGPNVPTSPGDPALPPPPAPAPAPPLLLPAPPTP